MNNDIELIESLRLDGWRVLGFGFKHEHTFTAEEINKRLLSEVTPKDSWLFTPSIENEGGFWLSVGER